MSVMRLPLGIAAVVAVALLVASYSASADEIWRAELSGADSLGTRVAADAAVTADGTAAIRIDTAWPTVINLAEVTDLAIDDAVLVYAALARSENLEGTAYLEMWCHFPGGGQYFSRGLDSVTSGTSGWQPIATRFLLEEGQKPDRVTLNLVINGRGTVWIDDVRLVREAVH